MGVKTLVSGSLWPVWNVLVILCSPSSKFASKLDLTDPKFQFEYSAIFLFESLAGLTAYIMLAVTAYAFTFPTESDFAEEHFNWYYWSSVIILRDIVITYVFYAGWHYLLYVNDTTVDKLKNLKFKSGDYNDEKHWQMTKFWTFSGTFISSLHEILFLYLYKNKVIEYYMDFWQYPFYSVIFVYFVLFWRQTHFYFIHRVMHPWFNNKSQWKTFDFGDYLYRNVHSLHHRSYNPGPWSGLAMHPIEHIFIYSCIFFPAFWISQHPIHVLLSKFHVTISALPGHDGYDEPGGGASGYHHYLHHAHYDCNYGTTFIPFDRWFGTLQTSDKYIKSN